MLKSFRDLHVWQKAMDLTDAAYSATADFPRAELFGLLAQIRKAAVSIPSNIAEGRAIGGGRFRHHVRIALGSEAELQTQIEIAKRRGYITSDAAEKLMEQAAEVGRMLHALHASLEARRRAGLATLLIVMLLTGLAAG